MYIPDKYPIIYHLLISPDDNIWIYIKSKEKTGFLRYTAEGKPIAFYEVESDLDLTKSLIRIINGKMYFIEIKKKNIRILTSDIPQI